MTDSPQLDTVLAMGLQLSAKERLKLVEQLILSVEHEIEPSPADEEPTHWGRSLVTALESGEIDTSEWVKMDISDPVDWVNQLREQDNNRLKSYWDHKE